MWGRRKWFPVVIYLSTQLCQKKLNCFANVMAVLKAQWKPIVSFRSLFTLNLIVSVCVGFATIYFPSSICCWLQSHLFSWSVLSALLFPASGMHRYKEQWWALVHSHRENRILKSDFPIFTQRLLSQREIMLMVLTFSPTMTCFTFNSCLQMLFVQEMKKLLPLFTECVKFNSVTINCSHFDNACTPYIFRESIH